MTAGRGLRYVVGVAITGLAAYSIYHSIVVADYWPFVLRAFGVGGGAFGLVYGYVVVEDDG